MSRMLMIRKPRWGEVKRLQTILETSAEAGIRRRAEAVLLYGAGGSATDIATALEVHPNTIYTDLQAFAQQGVAGVEALGRTGRPSALTEAQKAAIRHVAEQSPGEFGLPWGRWSLGKLREYLIQHRILKAISREHLREVLKKGACDCGGSRKSWSAPIPGAGRFWPVSARFGGTCRRRARWCSST